jgi:hypothetical protein
MNPLDLTGPIPGLSPIFCRSAARGSIPGDQQERWMVEAVARNVWSVMSLYVVTVKLPKPSDHDPDNKRTGTCAVSAECTDVTGEHHSYLFTGDTIDAARADGEERFGHVTRVELVT